MKIIPIIILLIVVVVLFYYLGLKKGRKESQTDNINESEKTLPSNLDSDYKMLEKVIELYLQEWKYRDSTYIKYMLTFLWASIVVSLFPYVNFISNSISDSLPRWFFPSCGGIMAIISLATLIRLSRGVLKVRNKYNDLLKAANELYEHEYVKWKDKEQQPMAYVLPVVLSAFVIIMDIVLLFLIK